MRRLSLASTVLALAVCSTAALALVSQHMDWTAKIAGNDGAKITGDATMKATADGKGTDVMVMLAGDAAGVTRPWHVHTGSCTKAGGVFGGGKAYSRITIDASGNGMSTATLAVAVPDTGSYYVNIHESTGNMGKIVACGDLKMKM
jgi:superoxide dismutase, Cu-Zn family